MDWRSRYTALTRGTRIADLYVMSASRYKLDEAWYLKEARHRIDARQHTEPSRPGEHDNQIYITKTGVAKPATTDEIMAHVKKPKHISWAPATGLTQTLTIYSL